MDYTDEELSRILTAHAVGGLIVGGGAFWGDCFGPVGSEKYPPYCKGCANQVAYNEPDIAEALKMNVGNGHAFDIGYYPEMSPEELLELLAR